MPALPRSDLAIWPGAFGNAIVPNDAPIQPPQAFVDNIEAAASAVGGLPIDLSNKGITRFAGAFFYDANTGAGLLARMLGNGINLIDLSGNAISSVTDVDSIVRAFTQFQIDNSSDASQAALDVSGGTNSAPTLPVFVIDFNNLGVFDGSQYGIVGSGSESLIFFSSGINLAASSLNWNGIGGFAAVGISDGPTEQQIIDKLVALGGGKIVDLGGLKARVSPVNYDLEPLDLTGMTGSSLTQGNNDIGTLRATGWTVTTN